MDELEKKIRDSKKVIGEYKLDPNTIFVKATNRKKVNIFNNVFALRTVCSVLAILVIVFISVIIFNDEKGIVTAPYTLFRS